MKINREKINPRQAALHNAIKALLDSKSEELQTAFKRVIAYYNHENRENWREEEKQTNVLEFWRGSGYFNGAALVLFSWKSSTDTPIEGLREVLDIMKDLDAVCESKHYEHIYVDDNEFPFYYYDVDSGYLGYTYDFLVYYFTVMVYL